MELGFDLDRQHMSAQEVKVRTEDFFDPLSPRGYATPLAYHPTH